MRRLARFYFYKQNLRLAVPIVFSNLGHMLTALADTVMIGQLGADPLAAASFAANVFAIFLVGGIGLTLGVTPLTSAALAKSKYQRVNSLFITCMVLYTGASLLISGLLYVGAPWLYIFNQPPDVTEAAIPYFRLLLVSLIPLMVYQAAKQTAEGLSLTKMAMVVSVGANLLNVGLNYLLIFGKLGAPALGLNGAGWATILARMVMAAAMLGYVLWPAIRHQYGLWQKSGILFWPNLLALVRIGMPISLQMLFEVSAFSGATLIVGLLGAQSLAAHQIALTITSVTYMAANGLAAASTVTVSSWVSKGYHKRARKAGFSMYHVNGVFMATCGLLLVTLRDWLPGLFINDPAVLNLTPALLLVAAIFQLSDGFQVTGQSALRGLADVRIPTLITFLAYWVIGLPLGYLLGIWLKWGVLGVWVGLSAGLSVAALLLTLRFHWKTTVRKASKLKVAQPTTAP